MTQRTELKDVLHFYVNSCNCQVIFVDETVNNFFAKVGEVVKFDATTYYVVSSEDIVNVRPILRRLQSMTEEQAKMLLLQIPFNTRHHIIVKRVDENPYIGIEYEFQYNDKGRYWNKYHSLGKGFTPEEFRWLCVMGFDLWNLIDSGQAIDADTLKQ